jgi:4-amino-4-deoxychorismate lyase
MLIDGVPSEQLPANDRGLAYGDGLFETIRIHRGAPLFIEAHLKRLSQGCARLGIPADVAQWRSWLDLALLEAPSACIAKLIVTRGSGGRGYRPPEPSTPRCLISLHDMPAPFGGYDAGISAFVCRQRLARQPSLAGIKHLNRLEQVLASREFPDASWHEGLMADYDGLLVEGTRSNVFATLDGRLLTPDLGNCGVAGVLRGQLLDLFGERVEVKALQLSSLHNVEELFICNSVLGIWPVTRVRHGDEEWQLQAGPYAREALAWLDGVLA